MVIYGGSKVGKTTFAATAPYPRLMLDIEGGHRFLPGVRYWDPRREAPPVADGTWGTCVVVVSDYDIVLKAYEWLRSGQHQFKSLIIDSISENAFISPRARSCRDRRDDGLCYSVCARGIAQRMGCRSAW